MAFDKDPLDVALDIKRGFARTVMSRDKPSLLDVGYALGVLLWWFIVFGILSVAGANAVAASVVAAMLCWFWPLLPGVGRR